MKFISEILIREEHRIEHPRKMIVYFAWKTNAVVSISLVYVIIALSCTNFSVDNGSVIPLDQERVIANLPADFVFDIYQGEDVVDGPRPRFSKLFAHGKPVVLNFWAGLCIPCRIEMPHFQRIYDERADEFIMLGLDVGPFTLMGTSDDGKSVLQSLAITYPTGAPIDGEVLTSYDVLGMPTTVFINPDGTLFRTWVGLLDEEKINEILDDLVSQSQGL